MLARRRTVMSRVRACTPVPACPLPNIVVAYTPRRFARSVPIEGDMKKTITTRLRVGCILHVTVNLSNISTLGLVKMENGPI